MVAYLIFHLSNPFAQAQGHLNNSMLMDNFANSYGGGAAVRGTAILFSSGTTFNMNRAKYTLSSYVICTSMILVF